MEHLEQLAALTRLAASDTRVLAVVLFGSRARGDATEASDTDVCLVAASEVRDPAELSELRLEYAGRFAVDLHVFQLVPLYVRERILSESRVMFVRDEDSLYDVALTTIRELEDYRPLYRSYLEEVARGGP